MLKAGLKKLSLPAHPQFPWRAGVTEPTTWQEEEEEEGLQRSPGGIPSGPATSTHFTVSLDGSCFVAGYVLQSFKSCHRLSKIGTPWTRLLVGGLGGVLVTLSSWLCTVGVLRKPCRE